MPGSFTYDQSDPAITLAAGTHTLTGTFTPDRSALSVPVSMSATVGVRARAAGDQGRRRADACMAGRGRALTSTVDRIRQLRDGLRH